MKHVVRLLAGFLWVGLTSQVQAVQMPLTDTIALSANPIVASRPTRNRDIVDVVHQWYPRLRITPHDSSTLHEGKRFFIFIPEIGYTLQTRGLVAVLANAAFRRPHANMSSITGQVSYTQNNQIIFTVNSLIWSHDNRYMWMNDWRLMHYPQATYGLGMFTSTTDRVVNMDYSYFRFYQTLLRQLAPNLYGGAGYYLDIHWNIDSYFDGPNGVREPRRISGYPFGIQGRSISSGPALQLLYDNRRNAINPSGGLYANAVFRANTEVLGSDDTYQWLLLEARKYIHLNPHTDNVLAIWSYNALTFGGDPPFLDMPSTGWDNTNNVGRGFIQGRFRGQKMLYLESEYRFHITPDRLLGGVVFANAQSVTEQMSGEFEKVVPAMGAGIRIRMNKISRTNLSIDYGYGFDGSHGLFFNLGEVF